jgi:hypothetical protein
VFEPFTLVSSQELAAAGVMMTASSALTPCRFVEIDRRFRDVYCHHDHSDHRTKVGIYSPVF